MSAVEPLWRWLGLKVSVLSKAELLLLEAELFLKLCNELKEIFRLQFRSHLDLMKLTVEKENLMLDIRLPQLIANDIVATKEYDPKGIAYYTNSFEEVIDDVMRGHNPDPSSRLLRKLIELHRTVRPELYEAIRKKIIHPA